MNVDIWTDFWIDTSGESLKSIGILAEMVTQSVRNDYKYMTERRHLTERCVLFNGRNGVRVYTPAMISI